MVLKRENLAIVACSNGLSQNQIKSMEELQNILREMEITIQISSYLYQDKGVASGTGKERAGQLMEYFMDCSVKTICDVSGGDLANEILPFLYYEVIKSSEAVFWGYSDLTAVINAIYARTGKSSVLYQIRNMVRSDGRIQKANFARAFREEGDELFQFDYEYVQGTSMQGIVVGGNIRCFLKLAGTKYWPDMKNKILLLESFSGDEAKITTALCQLQQMGVFEEVAGVLLGTFTELEESRGEIVEINLAKRYVGDTVQMAKTRQIGHGADSKAIVIGEMLVL